MTERKVDYPGSCCWHCGSLEHDTAGHEHSPRPAPEPRGFTAQSIADAYERASGVKGWKARVEGARVVLTAPAGYIITTDETGAVRLAKFDMSKIGFYHAETAKDD